MNWYRSNVEKFIPLCIAPGYIIWAPADPLSRNQRFIERLIEEEYVYTVENIATHSKVMRRSKDLWEKVIDAVSRTFRKTIESIWISRAL